MNTVAVRRAIRAVKVTIKHAGRAALVFTTFALLAGGGRGLHVVDAALLGVVHVGAHGGYHGALVLGAAARRQHRVGRAVLGRRRGEREDIVGLPAAGASRGRRLRLVGVRASEGHPGTRVVSQGLGAVGGQPGVEGRVEVRPTDLRR